MGADGHPAKGIRLMACPLNVALGAVIPETRTDPAGNYRFTSLPWWGQYEVYADDPEAGYSIFSTGSGGPNRPIVELSAEHPEAELNFRLPPPAGFLQVHLTNGRNGAVIPVMRVTVARAEQPDKIIFSGSYGSSSLVLLPPDQDLLLHVTSWGYQEWGESVGRGKPIRMRSGSYQKLEVSLDPTK